MNPSTLQPSRTLAVDEDLVEQARPGHGMPPQEPDSAAQKPLHPCEAEHESDWVLAGGGVMLGAAAGAGLGTAVAGPVGMVVGGTAGAVVGALAGHAVASDGAERDDATLAASRLPAH